MPTVKNLSIHLVLHPDDLLKGASLLGFIGILKLPKGLSFDYFHLDKSRFHNIPMELRPHAGAFLNSHVEDHLHQAAKQHPKLRSGLPLEVYLHRTKMRYLQESAIHLRTHLGNNKIYHRVKVPGKSSFRVAPCTIAEETPKLSFEVIQNASGGLEILPVFEIAGQLLDETTCQRYGFLLLTGDTYYILSQNDFLTLEWLEQKNPVQYSRQPAELVRHVLSKLEEKYSVNRNHHFPVHRIECVPENVLMLSEISNAFIVMTPQWKYDDIKVEGAFKEVNETLINGEIFAIHRDKASEKAFTDYLRDLHPNFKNQINGYFYLSFEEARKKSWFLKAYHEWLDKNIELQGMDMLTHFRYSSFPIATDIRILEQGKGILQLFMQVTFGKEEISLIELRKLLLAKQQYIMLKDDTMGILTEEWIKEFGTLLKHGKIHKNTVVVPEWIMLVLNSGQEQSAWKQAFSQDWWQRWQLWQQEDSVAVTPPAGLQASMRPYQQKGFEWMALLSEIGGGALLADDMGLGKTLQTIAVLLHLAEKNDTARFMIVCPASLMMNWQRELEKFAPTLSFSMFYQQQRDLDGFFEKGTQVLITSYGTMRSCIDELALIPWNAVVLDESHHIKNASTQTSQAVNQLNAAYRIALSGTPMMNNTEELYPQMQFLLPGLLGSAEFFRKEYAHPIDRNKDEEKIKALHKLTKPFMLRRTKKQVAQDLPEKVESVIWCTMGDEQTALYEDVQSRIRGTIFKDMQDKGLQQSRFSILQGLIKLRQLCAAPQMVKDLDTSTEASIKIDTVTDEILNLGQHKALVFSQFKEVLHIIGRRLQQEGVLYYHFDGDTPPAERHRMVEAFQQPESPIQVFLISLMAGNAGLNLTSADYVFLVDPWWNKAVMDQAIDRTHRIGQDKTVFAYKMICRNTIEERILKLQQRKQEISDDLISEENGFVKQLSEDDVRFLFG